MGRPRKWSSDAERKAAQRGNGELPEDVPGSRDEIESPELEPGPPALRAFPLNRNAPSLERYVAEAIEGARIEAVRQLARKGFGGMSASDSEIDIESRIAKAESYARWRWHGYRDGEIASL